MYSLNVFGSPAVAGRACKIESVSLSIRTSRRFPGIGSIVFSKFWHDVRNQYELRRDKARFFKKFFCPKIGENRPKHFFEFIEKLRHQFFLSMIYNESLHGLLYYGTNTVFRKNLFVEIYGLERSLPVRLQNF